MDEEVKKQMESVLAELKQGITKEVVDYINTNIPLRKAIFGGENHDADAQSKDEQKKAAEFLTAKYFNDAAQVKALSGGTSSEGKELVPEFFSNEIIRLAPNYGVIRAKARKYPVNARIQHLPTVGSVTVNRVGEKVAIPSSQPGTGKLDITIKKVAGIVPVSNELLKDANVTVVQLLTLLFAEAFAKYEDEWGFSGKAANEGIFQNTSVPVLTMSTGDTTYNKVTGDYLLDLMDKVDESALTDAGFYMSFSVFNALRKLKATTGEYIVQPPTGGQPATIWNHPVNFARVLPRTSAGSQAGTKFLTFANLNYMLFADAHEYELEISRDATVKDVDGTTDIRLFEQDMSAVRVIERVDIQLAEADKAFAVLKTAAS
ncbi:MAG: phage major capsid protein [bacterium]|nr:phage major capsid protein [bacterium]